MSETPATGWRLSQEQLRFLEELLTEAVLEHSDARLQAALEEQRNALKAALLEDLGAGEKGGGGPTDLPPDLVVADDLRGLESWVRDRLEEVADDPERVRPDDLEALEEWVRERLEEVADGTVDPGAAGPVRSTSRRKREPLPGWRVALLGLGMFVVLATAGWFSLAARVEWAVDQRAQELAALSSEALATVEQLRDRAASSAELYREIGAAATEVRERLGASALKQELVAALTADPEFVVATTGPRGPRGPVGTPERVGLAPGRFSFQNGSGVTVATVGQDQTGRGHAQIFGQSGAAVAYLGTENGTEGTVRVKDTSGRTEVAVNARRTAGQITLSTTRGQRAFMTAQDGEYAEIGVSNQSGDGGVTLRSQGGFGAITVNGMSVHDFAEVFELDTRERVVPGTVMAVAGPESRLAPSTHAYDRAVVGVVSGAGGLRPGMTIGSRSDGTVDLPIALSGQVYVRVNGEGGPIAVGDLLVASSTPGEAMRAQDERRALGAVIGKAMETRPDLDAGAGLVRMFVMAR